jgi:hypothetical protein
MSRPVQWFSRIKVIPSLVSSLGNYPILGHFDFIHTPEREKELHQVGGRILRNLVNNRTHRIGNRSVEDDRTHTHACKIHPHLLTVT